MCTFLFWMVHCGIWDRCIVGFCTFLFWMVHCGIWDRRIVGFVRLVCPDPVFIHDWQSYKCKHFQGITSDNIEIKMKFLLPYWSPVMELWYHRSQSSLVVWSLTRTKLLTALIMIYLHSGSHKYILINFHNCIEDLIINTTFLCCLQWQDLT